MERSREENQTFEDEEDNCYKDRQVIAYTMYDKLHKYIADCTTGSFRRHYI
jgi:hypothetical protein